MGGHSPVPVDVRLIAATDADLEERIRQDLFKAPLLHRLAGYEIQVPPLRERREDIGVLFLHFARQELEALGEAHRLEAADLADRAVAAGLAGGPPGALLLARQRPPAAQPHAAARHRQPGSARAAGHPAARAGTGRRRHSHP